MLSVTFSRKVIVVFNSDTLVYYFSQKKLSDMIDALIKRVSVTYKCYEMYAHRVKNVQLSLQII
jgi:hypothetical protein